MGPPREIFSRYLETEKILEILVDAKETPATKSDYSVYHPTTYASVTLNASQNMKVSNVV